MSVEGERNKIKQAYELLTLPSSKERALVRPSIHLSGTLEDSPLPLPPSVPTSSSSDAKTIEILRKQLDDLSAQMRKVEDEKLALVGSLAHRDTELARFVKTVAISNGNEEMSGSKLDQLMAADAANQKVRGDVLVRLLQTTCVFPP